MNVDILVLERALGYIVIVRVRVDITYRRSCAFFHYVAEMPGEQYFALSADDTDLDCQNFAADRRPGKPRCRADFAVFGFFVFKVFFDAQKLFDVVFRHDDFVLRLARNDFHRDLSHYVCDFLFQPPYAAFTGVRVNDFFDSVVGKRQPVFAYSVRFQLLSDKVFLCDLQFFFGRIAAHFDNFHTVVQRRGDRVGVVCRRDENHL